jgi:Flp pilus assembly pilin Flp
MRGGESVFNYLVDLHSRMVSRLHGEEGQGLVEYGLIITFVAIAAIVGLKILGTDVSNLLEEVGKKL